MHEIIQPASLSFRDGNLYSDSYGDIYASAAGGLAETRHVFLDGNQLPGRFRNAAVSTVIETGFGAGLNFLSTWQTFREHAPAAAHLHFVSVEKHPFRFEDLQRVLDLYPSLSSMSLQLLLAYPPPVAGFHLLRFDEGRVRLLLLFGDAQRQLEQLDARADAFFLDGFAPAKNPDMWSEPLCRELARLAAPGATLATYTVAGRVREALSNAGFIVDKRPGHGSKREMLVGRYPGDGRRSSPTGRRIVVIGAGIAGSHCAMSLAQAGMQVEVLEAGEAPAAATSANPAGLVRPFLSLDRGARSSFSLAAYLHAVRHYDALIGANADTWQRCGVLQIARDAAHADKIARALESSGLPDTIARWVDVREGSDLCGAEVTAPGLWFAGSGCLAGAATCAAALRAGGDRVLVSTRMRVQRIERVAHELRLLDAQGGTIAVADDVILANGHAAAALIERDLGLRPVRGQVSMLSALDAGPTAAVCQEGYVTPAIGGLHVVGATYDEHDADLRLRDDDHLSNIARARKMLPKAFAQPGLRAMQGWSGLRCVTRDRRPLLGPLEPGVHVLLALGSRGFTWAPLAAELVAAAVGETPLPMPRGMGLALSPHRFTAAQSK